MDRAYKSGASATPPSAPASPSIGYPTEGNPAIPTEATKPGPWWYHMVTEELMGVILAAGITPAQGKLTQLKQALDTLYAPTSLRGYIDGLLMSTAGSSTTMSVSSGAAVDSANAVLMTLSASIEKTTSAWAVGSGNGGLDTGSISPSTWYYFYVIRRQDTGVRDVIFSLSPTAPTLPANYTQYRYIGAGFTNGSSQWTKFKQVGDEFYWGAPMLDFNGAGSATASLLTCSIPSGRKMKGFFVVKASGLGSVFNGTYLSDPDNADLAPSGTASPLYSIDAAGNAGTTYEIMGQLSCWTNASRQIRHRESSTNTLWIQTLGWLDGRGRNI